jgi:hypothetical protein
MRLLAVLLSLFSFHAAAQTEAQQIQSTAPQLVAFAGSDANLQSLVNGLSLGQPVTLVTPAANGVLQIATFTPPAALGADTARALEQARTSLISRGISQPSAQQVAVALMGGALPTSAGVLQVPGVLTNSITANAVQVRNEVASAPGTGSMAFGGSAANLQALSNGLRAGTPITLAGTGANGAAQSVTFTAPGGPMSAVEANQALALANQSLAAQGILTPTPEQIRVALLGGTLIVAGGSPVALQGVLQGRTRNVSDSSTVGTSNSTVGTSNSPTISGAPTVSGPIISSPPVTAAPISGAGGTTPTDGVRRPSTAEGGANRGNVTGR